MSERPIKLAGPRFVRLFDEDAAAIRQLSKEVYDNTKLTMLDLIRDAVHEGLPLLQKRLKPMRKEVDQAAA